MKLYYLKSCSNLKTPIIYMLWNCFRIWELTRRENNADTSAAITCAIHHLVLRFHSYYLLLCQSYLCNRGNSAHFYSELFSIKNYIIDVISHGYFKSINSTQDGNIFFLELKSLNSVLRIFTLGIIKSSTFKVFTKIFKKATLL